MVGPKRMSTGSLRQKLVRKQSKVLSSKKSQWYTYISKIYAPSVSKGKKTYSEEIYQKT